MTRCSTAILWMLAAAVVGLLVLADISTTQRKALMDLYDATGGPRWSSTCKRGWSTLTSTSSVCSGLLFSPLSGVQCTLDNLFIIAVDLSDCNLDGTVPSSLLRSLSQVQALDLASNRLVGPLPLSGGVLHPLKTVTMSNNALNGTLPSEWASMTSLQSVGLSRNRFQGTLPSAWSNWTTLTDLYLYSNSLDGTLPRQWSRMTLMTTLSIYENRLSGPLPPEWSSMTQMVTFAASTNQLSGTLPPQWQSMTLVTYVSVGNNRLEGTLPPEWSNMKKLTRLYLYKNHLNGTLPAQWASLTLMTTLSIYENRLSGPLPPEWSSMTQMLSFAAYENELTGTLPYQWQSMTLVTYFGCWSNRLEGTLPPEWSNMKKLTKLYLYSNQLNGTLPAQWASLTQLEDVLIYDNKFSGPLPPQWSSMTRLTTFSVRSNQLSGTLPSQWQSMVSLTYFDVLMNRLEGPLPEEWSALTDLTSVYLNVNRLTGTLPSSWSRLVWMQNFSVAGNFLNGTLPASWSSWSDTTHFYALNNQFSGTLPSAWSSWSDLRVINLERNRLTGTIPPQWVDLTSLQALSLGLNQLTGTLSPAWAEAWEELRELSLPQNQLSGTLPAVWASGMTLLTTLTLSGNQLSGSLPSGWADMQLLTSLLLDNNALGGTLPASWGGMRALAELDLSANQLIGTLQASWSAMSRLQFVSVKSNRLTGTLPRQWSALTNLDTLDLSENQLTGTVPNDWGILMRSLQTLSLAANQFQGTIPLSWGFTLSSWLMGFNISQNYFEWPLPTSLTQFLMMRCPLLNCSGVSFTQNCFDLRRVIGSSSSSTGDETANLVAALTPQRHPSQCVTASKSLQESATLERTASQWVTHSQTIEPNSTTQSGSITATIPLIVVSVSVGPTVADEVVAVALSGPLASAALGAAAASNVQRAMLAMRVVTCTSVQSSSVVVGVSDNPLRLYVGGCGAQGADHCGAVLGNLLLLLSIIVCVAVYGVARWKAQGRTPIEWVSELGVPARLLLPVALLLQPTVSSIVWMLGYGHGNAATVVVALFGVACIGLGLTAYALRVQRFVYHHCVALADPAPSSCFARFIQRRTVWLVHPGYRGAEKAQLETTMMSLRSAILKYRQGRHWYYMVGIGCSVAAGIMGGLPLNDKASCEAVRYLLMILSIASLLAVLLLHPFCSFFHQLCQVMLEVLGLALSIATVRNDAETVNEISRVQLGFGIAASMALLGANWYDNRRRDRTASNKVREAAIEVAARGGLENDGTDSHSAEPLSCGQREWLRLTSAARPAGKEGQLRRVHVLVQFACELQRTRLAQQQEEAVPTQQFTDNPPSGQ